MREITIESYINGPSVNFHRKHMEHNAYVIDIVLEIMVQCPITLRENSTDGEF